MKLKSWLLAFVISCLVCTAVIASFNALVDPFGVFGDPILDWYGYNMTQNPRVAKVAWLEQNHSRYDSYIIGSSKCASISPEELNTYLDASFYNMTWYGGNLWDESRMVSYILEHYDVKNIILTLDPSDAMEYQSESEDLKQKMHCRVDGTSPIEFYSSYLFSHPNYAIDKLKAYTQRGFLQSADSVYLPETGVYNKQRRDATAINDLQTYLQKDGPFDQYLYPESLPFIDESVQLISDIKNSCDAAGVNLIVMWVPLSEIELNCYRQEEVAEYLTKVAQVTDSWNFMGSASITSDLRYYYDVYHFRNCVGSMMLARIFGNEDIYVPDDFGVYQTSETVEQQLEVIFSQNKPGQSYSAKVPILLYHSFVDSPEAAANPQTICTDVFEDQLLALQEAGYHTVKLTDLEDYVYRGKALPENPVVIIADDGYANNLDLAAPLLQKYDFCCSIAVIGCSVGKDTYKDTGEAIIPHFSLAQARPWLDAGVVELISHSYDMHQVPSLDTEDFRSGVLMLEGESEEAYLTALTNDFSRAKQQFEAELGTEVTALAYPHGYFSEISEIVLHDLGFRVTLSTEVGVNDVIQGIPQSLYQLRRITVDNQMTGQELVALLNEWKTEE